MIACLNISNKTADLKQGRSCQQLKWICLFEVGVLTLDVWKVFNLMRQLENVFIGGFKTLVNLQIRNQFSQFDISRIHFI